MRTHKSRLFFLDSIRRDLWKVLDLPSLLLVICDNQCYRPTLVQVLSTLGIQKRIFDVNIHIQLGNQKLLKSLLPRNEKNIKNKQPHIFLLLMYRGWWLHDLVWAQPLIKTAQCSWTHTSKNEKSITHACKKLKVLNLCLMGILSTSQQPQGKKEVISALFLLPRSLPMPTVNYVLMHQRKKPSGAAVLSTFKFCFSVAEKWSALIFKRIDHATVGHEFSAVRAPSHSLWFANHHVKISSQWQIRVGPLAKLLFILKCLIAKGQGLVTSYRWNRDFFFPRCYQFSLVNHLMSEQINTGILRMNGVNIQECGITYFQ